MSVYEYRFEKVALTGHKTTQCMKCGKKLRRQRTFWQTLNPFNRRPDGLPKSRADILKELQSEIEAWKQEPEVCQACSEH